VYLKICINPTYHYTSIVINVVLKLSPGSGSPEFDVALLMTKSCCDRNKVTCFKLLSQQHIESVRYEFYSHSNEVVQTQKIVSYMRQHSRDDGSVLYTVAGQEVCEKCFRMVYGIRYKLYSAMKAKFRSDTIVVEHGHLGRGSYTRTTVRVVSWLRMFINKVGDHMPSKPQIHLPSCLTKSDVYTLAVDDLSQGGFECCKKSTFFQVWLNEFPHVKIPKVILHEFGVF